MKSTLASCFAAALILGAASAASATQAPDDTLGYQAIQDGKWADAEAQIRAGLAGNPKDAMGLLNLAYVLQSSGRTDEAAKVYQQVLELDRNPFVALGPDSEIKRVPAKTVARKGMAQLNK